MKAKQADEELASAANAIRICGGRMVSTHTPCLVGENGESESRVLICVSKISATPENYPRHFSKISKKPL